MIVLSTWSFGFDANQKAWSVLNDGGSALDAAVDGVSVAELDPSVRSVGFGGHPNADGLVQVDAAVMDGRTLGYGAVAGIDGISTPTAVARRVMEETDHVLLVGDGAKRFAIDQGFREQSMSTPETKKAWEKWRRAGEDHDTLPADSHDTIGMVTLDAQDDLAAACTTSGIAYKMPGRVGDSPLIGCGLYADNEIGAAVATGRGEEIARTCGSFAIVNLMREGKTPQEACESVVRHLVNRVPSAKPHQMAYAAIDKTGRYGAAAARSPFPYAVTNGTINETLSGFTLLPEAD
jgi:N4-(beta-N-acetylglucosaminyl)-L-asparaginase